jgi:hypothetical protein
MKSVRLADPKRFFVLPIVSVLLLMGTFTSGQSTAFTYQGRLNQNGAGYTGTAEFAATLWDSVAGGTQLQTNNPVSIVIGVTNGLFTLPLDFGDVPFNGGADRWLDLQVRTTLGPFTTLTPRQKLTPTPYAMHAASANTAVTANSAATANVALTANSVPAANITGTLAYSQLPSTTVSNNQSGVNLSGNLSGNFSGNGANLTNLSFNSFGASATTVGVTAWGWDDYGQSEVPSGLSNIVAAAAGIVHSLALRSDGTIIGWGSNIVGELSIPMAATNVMAVSAGLEFSMALKRDGTVLVWGNNDFGQTNVPAGLSGVAAIAAGAEHCVALKSNGTVVAWGDTTNVPVGLNNVSAVAAGYYHALALQSNGTVVAWASDNTSGQTNIPSGLNNVVAIAAGAYHSLALKSDGTVVAWGDNATGQTNVPSGLNNIIGIACYIGGCIVLKSNGTVVVWGDNQYGSTNVPDQLDNVVALSPGPIAYHALALRKQVVSPMAFLNSDNTFNGSVRINGTAEIGGTEHVSGSARIDGNAHVGGTLEVIGEVQLQSSLMMIGGSNIWLSGYRNTGLGWYNFSSPFGGAQPDGPVLFGNAAGALGTTAGGQRIALWWDLQKRVGINTTSPTASLDVRGDIKFGTNGQYSVPATEENLRILRGTISSGGSGTGAGFTSSRTSTGVYAISFNTAFSNAPTVTATVVDASTPLVATVSGLSSSGVTINTYVATNGARANLTFYFTAIGLR